QESDVRKRNFGGRMKRWCAAIMGMACAWMLLAGCQKSIFVQEPDLFDVQKRMGLPLQPENDPTAGTVPFLDPVNAPATVTDPGRKAAQSRPSDRSPAARADPCVF